MTKPSPNPTEIIEGVLEGQPTKIEAKIEGEYTISLEIDETSERVRLTTNTDSAEVTYQQEVQLTTEYLASMTQRHQLLLEILGGILRKQQGATNQQVEGEMKIERALGLMSQGWKVIAQITSKIIFAIYELKNGRSPFGSNPIHKSIMDLALITAIFKRFKANVHGLKEAIIGADTSSITGVQEFIDATESLDHILQLQIQSLLNDVRSNARMSAALSSTDQI